MPSRYPEEAKNFRLLGHDPTAAWGGGSLVQITRGHAYVGAVGGASFNGPEGFTVHDVSDPRKPRKVGEFRAPPGVHMHKLRIVGEDILYVNSERLPGEAGRNARAGFYMFDISKPAAPREVGFYDMPGSGPHRFGVDNARQLAFFPNDAEGWNRRVIWTMDVRDPLKPEVVSIWGLPWQKANGKGSGNDPRPADTACTLHGPPMIRGNRMFAAFWGGGIAVIDCTDIKDMKLVGHVSWSPPFPGSNHTCWPIGDRPYLVAHCLLRIAPGILTIAASELLPAFVPGVSNETGQHGDAGRAGRCGERAIWGEQPGREVADRRRVCGSDRLSS